MEYENSKFYSKLDYSSTLVINEERFLKKLLESLQSFVDEWRYRGATIYTAPKQEDDKFVKYYTHIVTYPGYVPPPTLEEIDRHVSKSDEEYRSEGYEVFGKFRLEAFPEEELKENLSLHKQLNEEARRVAYSHVSDLNHLTNLPRYIEPKIEEAMNSLAEKIVKSPELRRKHLRRIGTLKDLEEVLNEEGNAPTLLCVFNQNSKDEDEQREQLYLYMQNASEDEIKEVLLQIQVMAQAKRKLIKASEAVENVAKVAEVSV